MKSRNKTLAKRGTSNRSAAKADPQGNQDTSESEKDSFKTKTSQKKISPVFGNARLKCFIPKDSAKGSEEESCKSSSSYYAFDYDSESGSTVETCTGTKRKRGTGIDEGNDGASNPHYRRAKQALVEVKSSISSNKGNASKKRKTSCKESAKKKDHLVVESADSENELDFVDKPQTSIPQHVLGEEHKLERVKSKRDALKRKTTRQAASSGNENKSASERKVCEQPEASSSVEMPNIECKVVDDKLDNSESKCPVCSKVFPATDSEEEMNAHALKCLENTSTVDQVIESDPTDPRSSHSLLRDQIEAFQYKRSQPKDDPEFGEELFFCHICQKDLSKLNSQRRQQHINRCCDKIESCKPKEEKKETNTRSSKISCPICGLVFKTTKSRNSHVKKCAQKNNIPANQVIEIMHRVQQDEQAEELEKKDGSVPTSSTATNPIHIGKPVPSKKRKPKESAKVMDEQTQIALALSASIAPPSVVEDDGLTTTRSKKRKKKGNDIIPALLLRSKEETDQVIAARAAEVVCGQNDSTLDDEISCTPALAPSSLAQKFVPVEQANLEMMQHEDHLCELSHGQHSEESSISCTKNNDDDDNNDDTDKDDVDENVGQDDGDDPMYVISPEDLLKSPDMCKSFLSFLCVDGEEDDGIKICKKSGPEEIKEKENLAPPSALENAKVLPKSSLWALSSLVNSQLPLNTYYVTDLLPPVSPAKCTSTKSPSKQRRKSYHLDKTLPISTEDLPESVTPKPEENNYFEKNLAIQKSQKEDLGKSLLESISDTQAVNVDILMGLANEDEDVRNNEVDVSMATSKLSSCTDEGDDDVFPSSGFCLPFGQPQDYKAIDSSTSPYLTTLMRDLSSMVLNPSLSDVVMITRDTHEIPAHKFMLAARSSVLAKMIEDASSQVVNGKVSLKFENTESAVLGEVLKFIYTATASVPPPLIDGVVKLAESLELEELVQTLQDQNRHPSGDGTNVDDATGECHSTDPEDLLNTIWHESNDEDTETTHKQNTQETDYEFDEEEIEEIRIFQTQAASRTKFCRYDLEENGSDQQGYKEVNTDQTECTAMAEDMDMPMNELDKNDVVAEDYMNIAVETERENDEVLESHIVGGMKTTFRELNECSPTTKSNESNLTNVGSLRERLRAKIGIDKDQFESQKQDHTDESQVKADPATDIKKYGEHDLHVKSKPSEDDGMLSSVLAVDDIPWDDEPTIAYDLERSPSSGADRMDISQQTRSFRNTRANLSQAFQESSVTGFDRQEYVTVGYPLTDAIDSRVKCAKKNQKYLRGNNDKEEVVGAQNIEPRKDNAKDQITSELSNKRKLIVDEENVGNCDKDESVNCDGVNVTLNESISLISDKEDNDNSQVKQRGDFDKNGGESGEDTAAADDDNKDSDVDSVGTANEDIDEVMQKGSGGDNCGKPEVDTKNDSIFRDANWADTVAGDANCDDAEFFIPETPNSKKTGRSLISLSDKRPAPMNITSRLSKISPLRALDSNAECAVSSDSDSELEDEKKPLASLCSQVKMHKTKEQQCNVEKTLPEESAQKRTFVKNRTDMASSLNIRRRHLEDSKTLEKSKSFSSGLDVPIVDNAADQTQGITPFNLASPEDGNALWSDASEPGEDPFPPCSPGDEDGYSSGSSLTQMIPPANPSPSYFEFQSFSPPESPPEKASEEDEDMPSPHSVDLTRDGTPPTSPSPEATNPLSDPKITTFKVPESPTSSIEATTAPTSADSPTVATSPIDSPTVPVVEQSYGCPKTSVALSDKDDEELKGFCKDEDHSDGYLSPTISVSTSSRKILQRSDAENTSEDDNNDDGLSAGLKTGEKSSGILTETSLFQRLKARKLGIEICHRVESISDNDDVDKERASTPIDNSDGKPNSQSQGRTSNQPTLNQTEYFDDGGFNCDVDCFADCPGADDSLLAAVDIEQLEQELPSKGTPSPGRETKVHSRATYSQQSLSQGSITQRTVTQQVVTPGSVTQGAFTTPSATWRAQSSVGQSPITPMPHYSDMDTPQLKNKVKEYGVRAMPKKRMVKKLKEIYQYTHPGAPPQEEQRPDKKRSNRGRKQAPRGKGKGKRAPASQRQLSSESEDDQEAIKKQFSLKQTSETQLNKISRVKSTVSTQKPAMSGSEEEMIGVRDASNKDDVETVSQSSEESDKEDEEFGEVSVLMENEHATASQQVNSDDLKQTLLKYMTGDRDLHFKILTYQPMQVVHLHEQIKSDGIKCPISKLVDFLDEQCISFTTAGSRQTQRNRRRGKTKPSARASRK
ncbi:uncharacterized protein LOC5519269 [Nematostella vectensis]|uniref:uncharacterized protein LOC5519269 n=1 Tax=Nematostella vectensis TaxID=45351 RepID=UPI002076FE46|nr:uncharacterized protein LOC5519269 [Nematostella vectensis]